MSRYVNIMKKGPVKPLFQKWKWIRSADPTPYGNSWMKEAWAEIPEVVFICGFALATTATACTYIYWKHTTTDYYSNKPYKMYYTVMRPDDSRVALIKADYYDRCEAINEKPRRLSDG